MSALSSVMNFFSTEQMENLHTAAEIGDHVCLCRLLQEGHFVDELDSEKKTPLLCAVLGQQLKAVKILLEGGADVNKQLKFSVDLWYVNRTKSAILRTYLDDEIHSEKENAKEEDTNLSVLHFATNPDIARILLEFGALVSAKDAYGKTPLHWAAQHACCDTIQEMLKAPAAKSLINQPDNKGNVLLHKACYNLHYAADMTRLLIEEGAEMYPETDADYPFRTCLLDSPYGTEEVLNVYIQAGLDVQDPKLQRKDGGSIIHDVVHGRGLMQYWEDRMDDDIYDDSLCGDLENKIEGFASSASEDEKGDKEEGKIQQDWKICEDANDKYQDILFRRLKVLVEGGCDINKPNNSGMTPLHLACEKYGKKWKFKHIQVLCRLGADATLRDNLDRTCLHSLDLNFDLFNDEESDQMQWAGKTETDLSLLKCDAQSCLLKSGADVNAQDVFGATVLHNSLLQRDHIGHVSLFLEAGADLSVVDRNGSSYIHYASGATFELEESQLYKANVSALKMLLGRCTMEELNAQDRFGSTALHYAVVSRRTDTVQILLEAGVNISIKDCNGRTALELAEFLGYDEIGKLISDTPNEKTINSNKLLLKSEKQVVSYEELATCCNFEMYFKLAPSDMKVHASQILSSPVVGRGLWENDESEVHQILQEAKQFIGHIGKTIAELNPILQFTPQLRGSVREGTKIGFPDEFDFLCVLDAFTGKCEVDEDAQGVPQGYVRLKMKPDAEDNTSISQVLTPCGYINCTKLACLLGESLTKTLVGSVTTWKSTKLMHNAYVSAEYRAKIVEEKQPAFNLTLRWTGAFFKNLPISIDVVPAVQLNGYIPQHVPRDFPIPVYMREVFSHVLLPCRAKDTQTAENINYFLSYTSTEEIIMDWLPEPVKKGYILAKAMMSNDVCPLINFEHKDYKPAFAAWVRAGEQDTNPYCEIASRFLSSYMLKNAMLWELHMNGMVGLDGRSVENCDIMHAIRWTKRIYLNLYKSYREDKFPSFFDHSRNLVHDWIQLKYMRHGFHKEVDEKIIVERMQHEKKETLRKGFIQLLNILLGNMKGGEKLCPGLELQKEISEPQFPPPQASSQSSGSPVYSGSALDSLYLQELNKRPTDWESFNRLYLAPKYLVPKPSDNSVREEDIPQQRYDNFSDSDNEEV